VPTASNSNQVDETDEHESFMPNYGSASRHAVAANLSQNCISDLNHHRGWLGLASASRTWDDFQRSEPETLRFCTFVMPCYHIEQDATDLQTLRIFNSESPGDRLLFGTARLDNPRADANNCYVVILSYAAPSSLPPDTAAELREAHKRSLPKFDDGEDVLGIRHAWDLLNVMLVRTPDLSYYRRRYERLGLGVIHCAALRHAGDEVLWDYVSLA